MKSEIQFGSVLCISDELIRHTFSGPPRSHISKNHFWRCALRRGWCARCQVSDAVDAAAFSGIVHATDVVPCRRKIAKITFAKKLPSINHRGNGTCLDGPADCWRARRWNQQPKHIQFSIKLRIYGKICKTSYERCRIGKILLFPHIHTHTNAFFLLSLAWPSNSFDTLWELSTDGCRISEWNSKKANFHVFLLFLFCQVIDSGWPESGKCYTEPMSACFEHIVTQ